MKVPQRFSVGLLVLGTAAFVGMGTSKVAAYEEYALGCHTCHGDFRASNYVSLKDDQEWGQSLMAGHNTFVSSDCNTCHDTGGFSPVFIGSSAGGNGLAQIGCLGCHGRDEGSGVTGAGLRQHHYRNGVTVCNGCHPGDSNPSVFTPVSEVVQPPYYVNRGVSHPNIPVHPCNLASQGYSEDVLGEAGTGGLDNDGDNLPDTADPECAALVPVEHTTWGRIKELYR